MPRKRQITRRQEAIYFTQTLTPAEQQYLIDLRLNQYQRNFRKTKITTKIKPKKTNTKFNLFNLYLQL